LVIVELAGFEDGALLLYERQQLTPFLLERYSKDGSDKARRQMLAMCNSDPDVLADVLAYFVEMYSKLVRENACRYFVETGYFEAPDTLLIHI
jgi:hypothetical protein